MRYNGTSFNPDWVKKQTLKQFLVNGSHGNKLTAAELTEAYNLITGAKAAPAVTSITSSVNNSVSDATEKRIEVTKDPVIPIQRPNDADHK